MPASLEAQQLLPPPSLREILSAYSSSSPSNSSHTSRSALLDLLAEKTSEDERIAHAYCDYGSKAAALLGTRQQALSTATEESQAAGAAPVSRGLESSSSRAGSAFSSSSSSRGKRSAPPSREESGPGRRSEKRLRKEATSSSSSSAHHPALSRSHSHNLSSSVQLPSSLSIDFSSHLSLPIPDPASQSTVSLPWTSSFFSYTTVPPSSSKALPSPYQLPPLLTISPSPQSSTSSPNPSQALSYFPRPSYSASSSYSADPTSSSTSTTEKISLLPSPASPNPPPRTDLPPLRQSLPYFSSSSVLHPQHPSDLQQNPPTNARRERPMAPPLFGYTPRPGADRSSSVEARGRLTLESLARVTIGGSSTETTEGASTRRE
jgi:hypothetical protein